MWNPTGNSELRGRRLYVEARCDCGTIRFLRASSVNKESKSCGCGQIAKARELKTSHGESNTRLYHIWEAMRARCLRPNHPCFARYGGRGITICAGWDTYPAFRAWAMGSGYEATLEIDRIDNDGGYSPENCRWASRREQQNNRHMNRLLTAFGESKTLADWARDPRCSVHARTIWGRLDQGWSAEDAITKPAAKTANKRSLR